MAGKADFTLGEWELLLEGPPSAGLLIAAAQRGRVFSETFVIGEAYTEARRLNGASQLLDEIVGIRPRRDRTPYRSARELKRGGLQHLRDAIALLEQKATPKEVDSYRHFVLAVARGVASAHRQDGAPVSDAEQAAIADISEALGD